MKTGVVTGGAYGSDTGCMPYEIPPCQHNGIPGPRSVCNATVKTPACSAVCTNKAFPNTIVTDRRMGSAAYSIANDALQIQTEIFTNGPVVAVFTVYDDFIQYQSGVYQYTTGSALGGHAIKIIGWGVEDGLNYWLVSNSWNSDWGSQSGFFKILRGVNHCGIEAQVRFVELRNVQTSKFYLLSLFRFRLAPDCQNNQENNLISTNDSRRH